MIIFVQTLAQNSILAVKYIYNYIYDARVGSDVIRPLAVEIVPAENSPVGHGRKSIVGDIYDVIFFKASAILLSSVSCVMAWISR